MTIEPRLGPPQVEDLSDVAWARVERGVFARMTGTVTGAATAREVAPPRRSWAWAAIPAVAAAACAITYIALRDPAEPTPATAAATTSDEPSRLVTGGAATSVSFSDAHITIEAHSAVVMDARDGKPTAILEDGAATFAVAPRGRRAPFVVLAGDARIRVIGTQFRVARHGERAEIAVEHGIVEVQFHGSDVRVPAGAHWSSDTPTVVTPSDTAPTAP